MGVCIADDAPAGPDELDPATVSRLLIGSRAIPFAVLRKGRLAFANPAFRSTFRACGAGRSLLGIAMTDLIAAQGHAELSTALTNIGKMPTTFRGRAYRLDGSSFDIQLTVTQEALDGVLTVGIFAEDVTWRQFSESHLSYLAYTDMLTGLPNRALAMDRLRDAIVEAKGTDTGLAVFMADLDGLKHANDTYGHQAGDVVLQVTAQRFMECIRDCATLARLGGDEFCFVLPRVRDNRAAEAIAARIVQTSRRPIPINDQDVYVGVSVGIALFPDHGSTGDALIAAADAALYDAKKDGRNRFASASEPSLSPVISLPLITWTPAHDVGVAMMDRQHRKLAHHVNELAIGLRNGDGSNTIAKKLSAALSYARHHFESEERLMDAAGLAEAAAHRESHARLLDDMRTFATGCDTRSLSLATRFLQEWLLRHIADADRELARTVIASGVR